VCSKAAGEWIIKSDRKRDKWIGISGWVDFLRNEGVWVVGLTSKSPSLVLDN
jgi:hypothetical protein